MGLQQSRRDDLESLGYMLIFLFKGDLPWCGIKSKNQMEQYIQIKYIKELTTVEELCEGMPN